MSFQEISKDAVLILSPFFILGAEQYAKEFGKEAFEQTKKLKTWLWNRFKRIRGHYCNSDI